ncbi:putative cyclic nucleotide-gated ion channel 18 [Dichanthelium oligosanthes]|uniref:Putative cyclic nucleotide-gated ion channel 18 n=1 Tax=Dichanthelium oligosanthes TaxID=888268 RepID=A0A1E5VZS1_9POAL|nr:putative cyclic nucleotide-gated ion channel 18 [Dichanthelium oligosanthes]
MRQSWRNHSAIQKHACSRMPSMTTYGLFADALNLDCNGVTFIDKYLYCLWWGFRNLRYDDNVEDGALFCSYGQNLQNSTYKGETVFCILNCIMGLVFFSHLIGNMQTYLQSMTVRLEEWRVKRRDIKEWMRHWQLPPELQERYTRTVRSVTEVEAFALRAEDLKYVANRFKRLQHAFRYYSHQWRSWGACFVQGAWRRYKKRNLAKELMKQEDIYYQDADDGAAGGDGDADGAGLGGAAVHGYGAPLLGEFKPSAGAAAGDHGTDHSYRTHHPATWTRQ